ncbi:MAG: dihydrodipicolinate synthase family protein, partial [Planctomycetales bacterium]|nr:dihydrodipicolinate synthase family protein [Planctomycetales bacterium]
HPLALNRERKFDERRQMGLARYYLAAGVGGLAVAVHTTQFSIREPQHNLLQTVLELGAVAAKEHCQRQPAAGQQPPVMVAGICGPTDQATREAALARSLDYHAGLLSLAALKDASDDDLLQHARQVAHEIPLIGFYLQPSVGGRMLSYNFWRRFCEIPNVIAIKVAPFNRYQTFDVVRAVAASGRASEIALYTGNDDSIVIDLLSNYQIGESHAPQSLHFTGGLLGHWACWTRSAVQLLQHIHAVRQANYPSEQVAELLITAHKVTDMNAAIFDAANAYRGCIAGVHEVLRRQGLLEGTWCLDTEEQLSPGQADEITRVCQSYPELTDDAFVRENLSTWLS